MRLLGKLPLVVGAAFALIAALCGEGYRRAVAPALAQGTTPEQAARTTQEFLRDRPPVAVRERPTLSGPLGELKDPRLTLPITHLLPVEEMRAVFAYAQSCTNVPMVLDAALVKALFWARFVCGDGTALPPDFFARPPFMHPAGKSYAALGAARGIATPKHLRHELEQVDVGRPALAAMVAGDAQLVTKQHVIFLQESDAGSSRYLFFPRNAWETFVSIQPVRLVERAPDVACLPGTSYYCWAAATRVAEARARLLGGAAIAALVVTALSLLLAATGRVAAQRRERAARARIVRTLTHELRTPATSLALALETLRDEFDELPAGSQTAFLRMTGDVERLKRVIAASAGYLRVERAGACGPGVASVNSFLAALMERYGEAVRFEGLAEDGALGVDPHWLEVGVANLVDNAVRHGKPPVVVRAARRGKKKVAITVEDGGVLQSVNLLTLAAGAQGGGLGLGLTLVDDVARAFGGALRIARPAAFTLELPSR